MASWTDTKTPQFNPYVQQLPVEAMVQVGMHKQKQYDEGIQKIQTNIDNIGGLDVIRDVDKVYLQSKVNELGNNLKTVAAGDFSNFQLVNSVNGMTNQIVKDSNVQSAIYSTANHRKNVSVMEKEREKGILAPENEMDYMQQFSVYNNSDKVGEKYNGRYTTYTDVNKKLFDIAKEVGIDENTVQQLYQTDDQGNVLKDKNGVPIWNPVMAEKHLKGKSADKILSAFQNALTPADYNQLSITGKYVNASKTPEQLYESIENNYSKNITLASGKVQAISLELAQQNSKNNKDQAIIDSLTKQKEFFETQKNNLESAKSKDLELLQENPDAVKASLYTNNYLSKMSHDLSSMTEDTKYSVSPLFTITMEQNRFNRDLQRDKIADYHWSKEQERADRKETYDSQKDKLELFLKYGVGTPPPGYKGASQGIDEAINVPNNKYAIVNSVHDDFSSGVTELNNINYQITLDYFKNVNTKKAGESDANYETRLKKAMFDYAASTKDKTTGKVLKKAESVDPNSGDINTFTARFAAKQLALWNKNPKDVPFEFRNLIATQNELSKDLSIQQKKMLDIKKEAVTIAKSKGIDAASLAEIDKYVKPTTVTLRDGSTQTLSKNDVIDFANVHPEVFNTFGALTVDSQQKSEREQATKRLKLKWGNKYKELENQLFGTKTVVSEMGGTREIATKVHSGIKNAGDFILKANYGKIAEIEAQLYVDKGFLKQPKTFPVQRGKENKEDVNARMVGIVGKYTDNLNQVEGFKTDDIIAEILSDKPGAVTLTATPRISSRQPVVYSMNIYNKEGKKQSLQISENDYTYLSKNNPMVSSPTPKVLEQINMYGTSGRDGSENPDAAWYSASSFKNLKGTNYTVTANLVPDKGNPNNLWFKMYVHNPDNSITPITYDQPISKFNENGSLNQDLDRLPEGINATIIKQLLNTNK
jgi:hypothetical protein